MRSDCRYIYAIYLPKNHAIDLVDQLPNDVAMDEALIFQSFQAATHFDIIPV